MTENEAMALMRCRIDTASEIVGKGTDGNAFEDMEMAISALEEVQKYREIGTVEECQEAVEKQKPKKTKELDIEYGYFICGNCGGAIAYTDDFTSHKYCLNCGQAIQWKNLEGMEDE